MLLFHEVKSTLDRTGEPIGLPVSLTDLKLGINYETTTEEDDAQLNRLQFVAVEKVEDDSQRALMPQTWTLKMDEFPSYEIQLRRPPILTVASVAYLDTSGVSQTLSSSLYDTDLTSEPGRILPVEGTCWPSTDCKPNAVTVTFTAGYQGSIPQSAYYAICLAVKAMIAGCEPDIAYWRNIDRLRWEYGGL